MSAIRTPDQRLRVFVSSTIEELREERRVVREAIEALRLIPVLFESGARPHPPRELYRAYLEQSDIFIGIYAASYGWVAPDMSVSGLEDEYRLSGGRPQIIYLKEVAEREPRLQELLRTIKSSDSVSYRKFSTPEQLGELLRNDLALLLSERFGARAVAGKPHAAALPAMRNTTIGRDRERADIAELLARPDVGLVTLTAPGGTGKSHLALRVAHDVAQRFPSGACFVSLASVQRTEQVLPTMAAALGVVDTGQRALLDGLTDGLAGQEPLVVVDNFEQVLDAAPLMAALLDRLPKLKLLVTSRAPLHIRGEQVYALQPLAEPADEEEAVERLLACPSVDLFVQRAKARAAQLVLDAPNVRAIATLCRHLNGLPLAIELAAAHTKYFTPVALSKRMDRTLDLLAHGSRDLPERQRTMRAAIASSVELLGEAHRVFFRRLAVFSERWTIDAAATVADADGLGVDPMEAVEQLVDMGLVRVAPVRAHDPGSEPRFILLHLMREFAGEALDAHGERADTMQRLQQWCTDLVTQAGQQANTDAVNEWMDQVEVSYPDLRAVIRAALDRGDVPTAWHLVAQMNTFWLLRGYRGEAMEWLRSTGIDRLATEPGFAADVPAILRAGVLLAAGAMGYYAEHLRMSVGYLERATELFQEAEAPLYMLFYARLFMGMACTGSGDTDGAAAAMDTALELARTSGDRAMEGMVLCYRTEVHLRRGELNEARTDLAAAQRILNEVPRRLLNASLYLAKGNVAVSSGLFNEAIPAFQQSIEVDRAMRIAGTVGWSQHGLGYCLLRLGRAEEGHRALLDGLATARASGYKALLMAHWAGLAWVAAMHGDHVRAARLMGASDALCASIQYSPWMATRMVIDTAREATAAGLPPEVLAAEMANGAQLAHEEVNALAMLT
ncbi:MAG: DUF4062 domain-containing protein [Flavobacteriales bacterium]